MKRISFLIALASLMLLPLGLAQAQIYHIELDGGIPSSGYLSGDTVIMGGLVTFTFRLNQDAPCALAAFTNGFEVYTKLSAANPGNTGYFDAITPAGTAYDTIMIPDGWLYYPTHTLGKFDDVFWVENSCDGKGKDTIGIGGIWTSGKAPGIAVGFSDDVWYVRTTPHTNGDTLCIDSAWFRPSNDWIWSMLPICVVGNDTIQSFFPTFGGPYCYHVQDTLANLVLSDTVLNFSAVEGGSNPADQTFDISSAGSPLDFTLSKDSAWLSVNPTSGTTDETITVSVDITGLLVGTYADTVTVTSSTAMNSPRYVKVNLVVEEAPNNPPVLDTIGPKVVNEDENLNFTVTASDPDGNPISLTVDILQAYFTDHGNDTGTFDWTPTFDDSGLYVVTFIASDGDLADTEVVAITVNNVNRPPVIDTVANTTIDECDTLELSFSATDLDGDSIKLWLTEYDNMSFTDNGDGTADLIFDPDFDQAGDYPCILFASDSMDTSIEVFTIKVEECYVLDIDPDTLYFTAEENGTNPEPDTFSVSEIGGGAVDYALSEAVSWFSLDGTSGTTPKGVEVSVDITSLTYGSYFDSIEVSLPDKAANATIYEYISLVVTPACLDTLKVVTVPAVPGAQVMVPVEFRNCCDLSGIAVALGWSSSYLYLDSVTFTDSRVADFPILGTTIGIDDMMVAIGAANNGSVSDVSSGYGNFVNMYFSVACEAQAGFYEIDLYEAYKSSNGFNPEFTEDCGEGTESIAPEFIPGGIVVDTTANYVCGYVVDTAGDPIPGATVELWADFPSGSPELTTTSNSFGAFAFSGFTTVPFDLWGYQEGYYPGLVQHLNFGATGVMIVLTPVSPVYPDPYCVNFHCGDNTFMGAPLPVGSVVDAYDPDGVHCGTFFVTTQGSYGFMCVYGEEPWNEGDQGAEPGDTITFVVNGLNALTSGDDPIWTQSGDSWEVCLEAGLIVTKHCDLMEGWNLVSWNINTESDDIVDVLNSLGDCLELVMGFEQGGLTYDPNLPQFSTLWYVDHLSGYWIKTNCDVTLEITGAPVPSTTPIPLTAGWNLVSYLPDFTLATEDALASLLDEENLIVALGYDGEGLIFLPDGKEYNRLDSMGPCFGYWLKVWEDGDLVYPGSGPRIAVSQKGNHTLSSASTPFDVVPSRQWINLYGRNLILDGKTVPSGATITAHAFDGTKIGSFTLNQDGLFGFMAVYADDPATSENEGVKSGERFYLAIDGHATNESFVWTQTGDKIEVESLTAKAGSDQVLPDSYSLNQNYPNPFNPTTTISFTLPVSSKAKVEIFNILGALVATPFDGSAQAGTNEVVWDGRNFAGETVSSGIYFYRLTADKYTETKKMTLLK
jgi:hypothetical protein